jgi:type I restriction enzyme S subunit
MIADLKPYPAMKDSGVAWLGDVPEHWDRTRLKRILRPVDHRSLAGSETLLSLRRDHGVVIYADHFSRPSQGATTVGFKLVQVGQLVVNRLQANNGLVFHSRLDGLVSPDYSVFEARVPVLMEYLSELLRTTLYRSHFRRESTGLGTGSAGFLRLYDDRLLDTIVVAPSFSEQAAIVRFLDHADRRIRRYILAKQKLIKLLEEQKQAIIYRAVTRGLNPNVSLKPSGVEWLGEVPEHWEVLPLKRWVSTKITDGPHETPPLLDDGIPFMSAESMVDGRLDFSRRRAFISRELHEVFCRKCRPQRGDIFMCKSGATTGKVAIVDTDDEFSVWSPLALIRVNPERVLPRLLFAVLQGRYVQRQVQDTWSYGTQPNLAMAAMERLAVVLPPIEEQCELLAHIDQGTKPSSEAIERARREISLLREYRTRLVADVVTGKLDVRTAATSVLVEIDEPKVLDDTEAQVEGDEDSVADDLDAVPKEAEA